MEERMNAIVATIEIKVVLDSPHNLYMAILGGSDGISGGGLTAPIALRDLADKLTVRAERIAVPGIIAEAIRRSAELEGCDR
jgi:hypothetical protein